MHNREENLKNIRLASDDPDLTAEEEFEFYLKKAIRTKEQLLAEIQNRKKSFIKKSKETTDKSEVYYSCLIGLIDRFHKDVESMFLMEPLNDWWGYGFIIRETGIKLKLEHLVVMYDDNRLMDGEEYSHLLVSDEDFAIHETKAKLLSLEEYGSLYDVSGDTVRQWIRRGKIRSAIKLGNDWRVPELVDKPDRGYRPGAYVWSDEIINPPEEIPNLNDYDNLTIQSANEPNMWTVRLSCIYDMGKEDAITLNNKTKEKFELYLISHPMIECLNNCLGEVHQMRD